MEDVNIFLDKLWSLRVELEKLSREFSGLYSQYEGNDFEGQNNLATDKLDNLILAATHEVASIISFTGKDIKILTDFINFLKAFKEFKDNELESIIDHEIIAPTLKLNLTQRLTNGDTKLFLNKIQNMRQSWNQTFNNKNYKKVRNRFMPNL
mgnify:CR=1 FL=1